MGQLRQQQSPAANIVRSPGTTPRMPPATDTGCAVDPRPPCLMCTPESAIGSDERTTLISSSTTNPPSWPLWEQVVHAGRPGNNTNVSEPFHRRCEECLHRAIVMMAVTKAATATALDVCSGVKSAGSRTLLRVRANRRYHPSTHKVQQKKSRLKTVAQHV